MCIKKKINFSMYIRPHILSKSFIISVWFFASATSFGVFLYSSLRGFLLSTLSIMSLHISKWPLSAAKWRGVQLSQLPKGFISCLLFFLLFLFFVNNHLAYFKIAFFGSYVHWCTSIIVRRIVVPNLITYKLENFQVLFIFS